MVSVWKKLSALKDAFNDAANYQVRENKAFFAKIFLRTDELQRCLDPSVYFLIGEKGTGKTAYATYIENNPADKFSAKVVTLTETQYKRFIELKKHGKLSYSDFANVWRQILLVVTSQVIIDKSKGFIARFTGKFSKVENQLKRWNQKALNPEVEVAFEAVLKEGLSGKLGNKDLGEISGESSTQDTVRVTETNHRLLESELALKQAIGDLNLSKNHIVFIDGIDFRPNSISYSDYLGCIRGLGEAVWQLNQDYFSRIRDSIGRIKIVLLVRPDVFHLLGLHNSNSRIQDNSVFLDWSTTEAVAAESSLFEVSGKYLSSQQTFEVKPHDAWNQYFGDVGSFKRLLRISFQKPRDILTLIKQLRLLHLRKGRGSHEAFDSALISDGEFTRKVADYLLGEVRDYASFYMGPADFSAYIKFFQYLNGRASFSMDEFELAFDRFSGWLRGEPVKKEFASDSESLLQFFYDVNVIGYQEAAVDSSETFVHWSFRERSLNNLNPKVKSTGLLVVNPGIAKALEIGKAVASSNRVDRVRAPKRVRSRRRKPRRGRPQPKGDGGS